MRYQYVFILLIMILLAGCASDDGAPKAIEDYYHALAAKDSAQLATLSCADWEAEATRELDSLIAVDMILEDIQCKAGGDDGDFTLVDCTGTISLTYNDENREIDLSARTYKASFEGGEWRMCGYAE